MNKIFYLASCDTCRKIIKTLPNGHDLVFHDIKQNPLSESDLQGMYAISGNYEALFSKKAQLYKSMGLKDRNLTETDFKKYLLEHGIKTEVHYPIAPCDQKSIVNYFSNKNLKLHSEDFKLSREIHATELSLPCSTIHNEDDISHVVEIMNKF